MQNTVKTAPMKRTARIPVGRRVVSLQGDTIAPHDAELRERRSEAARPLAPGETCSSCGHHAMTREETDAEIARLKARADKPRSAEAPPPWPAIGDHVDMTKAVLVDFHGRSGKVEELRPNEARIRWDTWVTTDWVSVRDLRRRESDQPKETACSSSSNGSPSESSPSSSSCSPSSASTSRTSQPQAAAGEVTPNASPADRAPAMGPSVDCRHTRLLGLLDPHEPRECVDCGATVAGQAPAPRFKAVDLGRRAFLASQEVEASASAPVWEDLRNKERRAWCAAASAVANMIEATLSVSPEGTKR